MFFRRFTNTAYELYDYQGQTAKKETIRMFTTGSV